MPRPRCCSCLCGADGDPELEPYSPASDFQRFDARAASESSHLHHDRLAVVGIDDFEIMKTLGRGSYGHVLQVRKRDNGVVYAMKVMAKSDVLKRNQVRHTLTERNLLQAVRHPFIVPLHFAFQTEASLYLVMEFQCGGELFFHLRREGAFAEARVRLYAAEILLALEALHAAGYVYRDLKPENVLLDMEGHARLSDFGLAKAAVTALDSGGSTFCGTPSYMAPEVLLGTGHGKAVDWWSFGTIIFEMLAGGPPFYSRNLHAMYRAILSSEVRWPPNMSRPARAMLAGLFNRDPLRRLGAKGSAQVRRAGFFRSLDFRRVFARDYAPQFRPPLLGSSPSAQALDTSNFDEVFTAEDPQAGLVDASRHGTRTADELSASTSGVAAPARGCEPRREGTSSSRAPEHATLSSTANPDTAFASWGPWSSVAAGSGSSTERNR